MKFFIEKKSVFFSLLCFLLLFVHVAPANSADTSVNFVRYMHGFVNDVQGYDNLFVRFGTNKKLCSEKYGKEWWEICSRSVGKILPNTKDIKMSPQHSGKWEWSSNNRLVFNPDKAWPADVDFTIEIGEESLPKYTKITNNIRFRTRPVSMKIQADFKFDPEQYKKMMVSGSIHFNYPMNKESVLERFSITPDTSSASGTSNLLLGEKTVSFYSFGSILYFSAPVLKMPDKTQSVLVRIDQGIEATSGGALGTKSEIFAKVPAKNDIFELLHYEVGTVSMPDLSVKQTFIWEFSMPVLPKDVLELTSVLLLPRDRVQNILPNGSQKAENANKKPPYKWWNSAEVTDEILKNSTPVIVEVLGDPDVPTRFVTFVLKKDIEAGRYLKFSLKSKLKGPDDFILPTNYSTFVSAPPLRGNMRIMQQGAVLALDGEKKLALYSRNADAVHYEVSQVRPEFLSLYVANMGNDFAKPYFSRNLGELAALSVLTKGKIPLEHKNAEEAQFTSLDLKPFLKDNQKGLFHVSVESSLNGSTQYSDNRFVMLTDIGLIRKVNVDRTSLIYVVSLADGKPMRNVLVQVLGKNGIAIFEKESDSDGMLAMPDLSHYFREKKPTVLVAHDGDDLAFLPFNDYQRELDIHRFEVSGKSHVDDGLYGFVFTQRDIYRPGESAYFGLILKQGDFDSKKLKDMPLQAYIRDPRGNIIERKKMHITATGLGDIHFAIPKSAQSGLYTLYVKNSENSGVLVSKNFHVEEFQPDTLRVDVEFDIDTKANVDFELKGKKGWFLPSELKFLSVDIELMQLFGTPAANNLLNATATVAPTSFVFKEYADWKFFDAAVLDRKKDLVLGTKNTDEFGKASFVIHNSLYEKSTALLTVLVNAFDASGGDSVQKQNTIMVSPLSAVLGWKSSSNVDYIPQNDKAYLEIISVDSNLKPYAYGSFTWEYYEINYVRSLVKNNSGEFIYRKERKEKLVESKLIKLPAKEIKLALDTKKSGEKMLVAKDSEGRIILRVSYTVAGNALAQFGEEKTPDLRAKINKTEYDSGEEMEIYLNLPYDGAGLITVERDKVFMQQWFKGKRGEQVQKITLSDNFEGKAYLNILYFRDIEDEDIFTKPCANVILPFTANLKARELDLSMEIVREKQKSSFWDFGSKKKDKEDKEDKEFIARPGTEFSVRITSPKAAKAIVYAVDEGILQMTNYQSPDPIKELLVQRALEVRTYQYFDLLMPEYSLLQNAIPSFGGDLAMSRFSGATENPFARKGQKPAVFWSGIVDVDKDGTVVNIPIPATFNGQLRIMAVACSAEAIASVQEDVLVQAEVVMQPSLRLFLAPGDEFDATLTLTDMYDGESRNAKNATAKNDTGRMVDFSVNMSPALELVSKPPAKLELFYAKQKTLTLRFRVKTESDIAPNSDSGKNGDIASLLSILGEQEITFVVSTAIKETGALSTVSMPVSLSVRPPQAKQTRVKMGRLSSAEQSPSDYTESESAGAEALEPKAEPKLLEAILPLDRNIYPQFAEVYASVSPLPLPLIQALVQMLREYPYPCTEQYVSKTLPLLTVLRHTYFAPQGEKYTDKSIQEEILKTLQVLASRYKRNASFSMWPSGYGKTSLLYTVYTADFVTEAMHMGISVPSVLRVDLLRSLENNLSSLPSDLESARAYAYGAWVLTRNGVITSNILANLTAWLDANVDNWKIDIVAPLMAASMKLMMQESAAHVLLDGYSPDKFSAWTWSSSLDGLAQRSLYLTILAKHFPKMLTETKTQNILEDIIALTMAQRYVTLSAAQASRALMLYSLSLKIEGGAEQQHLSFLDADNKEIALTNPDVKSAMKKGAKPYEKQNQGENTFERFILTDNADIISQIAAVKYVSSVPSFYQVTSSAYDKDIPHESVSEGMEISREYRDLNGNIIDELKVGDDIVVAIRARSLSGYLSNIVISDLLPAAFEFVIATGGNVTDISTQDGFISFLEQDMNIMYADRREDRLILFVELGNKETVFRYRVRVANRGNFVIPPISAESMYNPSVHALSITTLGNQKEGFGANFSMGTGLSNQKGRMTVK